MLKLFKNPISIMITSVVLWMLYPSLINLTIGYSDIFSVAAIVHVLAALSNVALVLVIFKGKSVFSSFRESESTRRLAFPSLMSGLLICANHLLLYAALESSNELDFLTIIIFETWPLFFFYLDSVFRRKGEGMLWSDAVLSGVAFIGFIILSMAKVDLGNWDVSIDDPLLTVSLAFLGGIAMAFNCLYRMKTLDECNKIATKNKLNLSQFQMSLITEAIVRTIAAPFFILMLFIYGEASFQFTGEQWCILVLVGVGILSFGSLLYDLAIFKSTSSAITSIWYFMPVGAVLSLSMIEQKWLTMSEVSGIVLILFANIMIGTRIRLSKKVLMTIVALSVSLLFAL